MVDGRPWPDPSYDPEETAPMNLRVFTRMRLTGGCRFPVDGEGMEIAVLRTGMYKMDTIDS